MTVPIIAGTLTCPFCGREMKVTIGQYGMAIRESCEHKFHVQQGADKKLTAVFDGPNVKAL